MAISEKKMQIVMNNYFKAECTVNTSIREAFEKGFRIGVQRSYDVTKESERKWTPVTEALPENDDWVIVSIYDDDGDTSWQYTTPGFYVPYGKCWIVDNEYCRNVIAWMPLPESYKGE